MKTAIKEKIIVDVIECHGNLNAQQMSIIKRKIDSAFDKTRTTFLINLARTKHVDLAGLGILVDLISKLRTMHGDIKLCNIKHEVVKTFQLVGLLKLIEHFDTEEEALKSLNAA